MFGQARAAAALVNWLDEKGLEYPGELARFPDGRFFFRLSVLPPFAALVLPAKNTYVLAMGDQLPGTSSDEFNVGSWRTPPEEVFNRLLSRMCARAEEYLSNGDERRALEFARSAAAGAHAIGNVPLMASAFVDVIAPSSRGLDDLETLKDSFAALVQIQETYGEEFSDDFNALLDLEIFDCEERISSIGRNQ